MRGSGNDVKSSGGRGKARESTNTRKRALTLRLKPEERELVRLACKQYRNSIPSYLAAKQEECRILDDLICALE
jgi:hypothetical protein